MTHPEILVKINAAICLKAAIEKMGDTLENEDVRAAYGVLFDDPSFVTGSSGASMAPKSMMAMIEQVYELPEVLDTYIADLRKLESQKWLLRPTKMLPAPGHDSDTVASTCATIRQALDHKSHGDGTFYMSPPRFPCVYHDKRGCILFTKDIFDQLVEQGKIAISKRVNGDLRVNVRKGISVLPGYTRCPHAEGCPAANFRK